MTEFSYVLSMELTVEWTPSHVLLEHTAAEKQALLVMRTALVVVESAATLSTSNTESIR
jgi:hypothetical protein